MKDKQRAQGLVEYALILVLVAIAVIALIALLGSQVEHVFSKVVSAIGVPSDKAGIQAKLVDSTKNPDPLYDYPAIKEFREYAINQEESLGEVNILFGEAVDESLEVLIEYAQEVNDLSLLELAAQAVQAAEQGNYLSVQAVLLDIVTGGFSLPSQIQIDLILKVEPLMIDAYWELEDTLVPQTAFDAALAELEAQEFQNPASTGDAISLMGEIWDTVNLRNIFIIEGRSQFAQAVCMGTAVLKISGEDSYIELAEKFEAEIGTCE